MPTEVATPTPEPTATAAEEVMDPQRFSYAPDFYAPEIQSFLNDYPGPLKDEVFGIGDDSQSLADLLVRTSALYSINPKILLTLLEQQSSLLSTPDPTEEQMTYAMGFPEGSGLYNQFSLAAFELRLALRDYAVNVAAGTFPALVFEDGSQQAVPADISLTRYALSRVLARTTTPDQLAASLSTFHATYTRLFDDPLLPPTDWPPPAEPFLTLPMDRLIKVTSFFDHDTPLLHENGEVTSYWGRADVDFPYDGHPGWDYGMKPPDIVLAAADGTVVFAGNSSDGCDTIARAVIIDHHNGYRTLYWHLDSIAVETGQEIPRGTPLGVAGDTGCAQGPHLHFQVQYLGRDVDPYGWCASDPDVWATNPAGQASTWLWKDMPSPCGPLPPGAVAVDNLSPGFTRTGAWEDIPIGYSGDALFTQSRHGMFDSQPWQIREYNTPLVAIWQPKLPTAGHYRVLAYIPYYINGLPDTQSARYRIVHHGGDSEVIVDNSVAANGWADLGTYEFYPNEHPLVSISTLTADNECSVWVDAIVWMPVQ